MIEISMTRVKDEKMTNEWEIKWFNDVELISDSFRGRLIFK